MKDQPIARDNEQRFACILRNRSGIDSGAIDYRARFIDELPDSEQQDAIDCVYAVYRKWCMETGKEAARVYEKSTTLRRHLAFTRLALGLALGWITGTVIF